MKVLIVSHNPLSTYQSMGKTMLSFFSAFPREDVYQLYVYPSVPDVDQCQSYYRITDKAVAKGVFTRNVKAGTVAPNLEYHSKFETEKDKTLYSNPKNGEPFRLFARDIMWRISPWWNQSLKKWLDAIRPDCIFLAPGNCAFIYNIALKIARTYDIGIVSYICDEYYFIKRPKALLEKIRTGMVRRKIAETMKQSAGIVAICRELEEKYTEAFQRKTITIMTGTNHTVSDQVHVKFPVSSITFMGNLACNRDRPVYDLGQALDMINRERGTNYRLIIYTSLTDAIRERFEKIQSIELHDFISGKEFETVFWNVEMFLHIEDFQEDSIDRVKHSVSTKIADILASGIPLFAYGPETVASMGHLMRNRCAICAVDQDSLKETLLHGLSDEAMIAEVAQNGLKTAQCYHDPEQNSRYLRKFFKDCLQ